MHLNIDLSLSSSLDLENLRLLHADIVSRTLPFRVKLEAHAENLENPSVSKLTLVPYGAGPRVAYTSSRETSSEFSPVFRNSCPSLMSGFCTPYHMLFRDTCH